MNWAVPLCCWLIVSSQILAATSTAQSPTDVHQWLELPRARKIDEFRPINVDFTYATTEATCWEMGVGL